MAAVAADGRPAGMVEPADPLVSRLSRELSERCLSIWGRVADTDAAPPPTGLAPLAHIMLDGAMTY